MDEMMDEGMMDGSSPYTGGGLIYKTQIITTLNIKF